MGGIDRSNGSVGVQLGGDWWLLAQFAQQHCERSFALLSEQHRSSMRAAARRVLGDQPDLIDDAVQQSLILLAEKAIQLKPEGSLKSWLCRTTGFCARNLRRGQQRRCYHERHAGGETPLHNAALDTPSLEEEEPVMRCLQEGIAELSPKLREAVTRYYFKGESQKDIASACDAKVDTVKKRVQNGVKQLRSFLRQRGHLVSPLLLLLALRHQAVAAETGTVGTSTAATVGTTNWWPAMVSGGLAAGVAGLIALAWPPSTDPDEPDRDMRAEATTTASVGSQALADGLGPFVWTRSGDNGETARLDLDPAQQFPWQLHSHVHAPWADQHKLSQRFGVNSFVSHSEQAAYRVQWQGYRSTVKGAHRGHLILGWGQAGSLAHGDQQDLAHRAGYDRLVTVLSARHSYASDPDDAASYTITTDHHVLRPGVYALHKGQTLFHQPRHNDTPPQLLYALDEQLPEDWSPGLSRPLLQFDAQADGDWQLRIEFDGTDGLSGGESGWDLQIAAGHDGARPHGLDLTGARWSVATISPGAEPERATADFVLGLEAYDRATGATRTADWRYDWLPDLPAAQAAEQVGRHWRELPQAIGRLMRP